MKFLKNQSQPKSFKKRYKTSFKFPRLLYGNIGIYFLKQTRIENIYLFDLKKKLKFFLTKQKKGLNNKLWLFIKNNYPISKKSKNSRMGKGKGKFLRLCTQVSKNFSFMEFLNINPIILKKIFNFFERKNYIKIKYIYKYNTNILWKKKNISFYQEYHRY